MKFLNLEPIEDLNNMTKEELIDFNKRKAKLTSKAEQESKLEKCYYCGKTVSSFCNSHSLPAFCIKNIAVNGEVFNTKKVIKYFDDVDGIKKAGTFRLICQSCDSKIFADYENPNNYEKEPTSQMLAQISMKNYLYHISKKFYENALWSQSEFKYNIRAIMYKSMIDLDFTEYQKGYEKAKRLSLKNKNDDYYMFFYKSLNYVVPIAFQSSISLVCDLKGNIINDIYNYSPNYHTQELHICIFPLKNKSVIFMFIDSKDKRYRNFYKQLKKLSESAQLSIINYMIFLYSEDIFISKNLNKELIDDPNLYIVSQKNAEGLLTDKNEDPIESAKQQFDLSNYNTIPNFLDEKYSIKTN